MGRGERVARGYVGTILLAQAVVVALATGHGDATGLAAQVIATGLLWLPLWFEFRHTLQVRALTALPAVLVSIYWASQSLPMGLVAWGAWALITAYLCFPAGTRGPDTLAQRFAVGRAPTTGVHHQ
jgi:hypothetical protein